jgi:chromosome segregation ATPase
MDDSFASARGELEDDGDGDDDRARVDGARRRVDGARASGREGDDFGDDDDEDDEDDDDDVGALLASTTRSLTEKLRQTCDALRESERRRTRGEEDAAAARRATRDASDALEREREARLDAERRARDAERALDETRTRGAGDVESLRRELREARTAGTNRAEADARAYDVAEARAVASVAVADLERARREFAKEWRTREMEYEATVRDLERRVSSLNARLAATSDDVERALERASARRHSTPSPTMNSPPSKMASPQSVDVGELRERLSEEQESRVATHAKILDLCSGRREMAREILDLSSCDVGRGEAENTHTALARARAHRAEAEALAAALAERVDVLERARVVDLRDLAAATASLASPIA